MENTFPLELNFRGTDFIVNVDLETANILLNDPEEREKFCSNLIDSGELHIADDVEYVEPLDSNSVLNQTELATTSMGCSSITSECDLNNPKPTLLWQSKGRPTEMDNAATETLLQLRKKYMHQFDDRKTVKVQLWQTVAKELRELGFNIGDGKDSGIKCRQKFSNLTRTYLAHKRHKKTTGTEYVEEPPFYTDMDDILGFKDKVEPKNLKDSLEEEFNDELQYSIPATDDEEDHASCASTSSSGISSVRNRFKNIPKTIRPKASSVMLLEEIKKQHKETIEQKNAHFETFNKFLKETSNQNAQMLNVFEKLCNMLEKKESE